MLRPLAICLAVLPGLAVAGSDDHKHDHAGEHHDEVHVSGGWMAETTGSVARVFFEIENEGDETVTLTGLSSPLGDVSLMAPAIKAGGEATMLADFTIAPGEALEMEPDGLFVAVKISAPLFEGQEFPIIVTLDGDEEIEVDVDVEGADAESISHDGHNH